VTLYDFAYLGLTPVAAGVLTYKSLRYGKYRESTPAMFGRLLQQEDPAMWRNGSVWVHAVSVGEVIAAKAMLPLLKQKFPHLPLLLTTHTETGQAQARQLEGHGADAVRYYPVDFSWVVREFAVTYKPKLFIPMETELWPNSLNIFAEHGAKIFVLNGKISAGSFRSYNRFRGLLREPLSKVTAFCVQTEADRKRIETLTGGAVPVEVTGNCKFDVPAPRFSPESMDALRQRLGLAPDRRLVVVGSTHEGEEPIVLDAWAKVREQAPDAVMVLVPRHPERFDTVWNVLQQRGFPTRRSSSAQGAAADTPSVILVDEMGVLVQMYGLANVAVVAGSFVEGIGGHNLMEPAIQGVPVVYGPYMKKQPDMTRILDAENGGARVSGADQLADEILTLLKDSAEATRRGELGRKAFLRNRGAAQRNIEVISRFCS